jgi:hypothetical protein
MLTATVDRCCASGKLERSEQSKQFEQPDAHAPVRQRGQFSRCREGDRPLGAAPNANRIAAGAANGNGTAQPSRVASLGLRKVLEWW